MRRSIMRDYGGDNWKRGNGAGVARKGNTYSYRCRDCKRLRYLLKRDLSRAAMPRCLHCGGPLTETEPSHERRLDTEQAIAEARNVGDTELVQPPLRFIGTKKCWGCGFTHATPQQLTIHLLNEQFCRSEYERDGKTITMALHRGETLHITGSFYPGTAEVSRGKGAAATKPWKLHALRVKAIEPELLGRFNQRSLADEIADHMNGKPANVKPAT
jgi:hypothetical protein